MKLGVAEQIAHSTVRIECDLADGTKSFGTGFFYHVAINDQELVPLIITNKHVVAGAVKGRFLLTLKDSSGGPAVGTNESFELTPFEKQWFGHPDSGVDLCAMPIAPVLRAAEERGMTFYYTALDKKLIPSAEDVQDMIGIESITMVGYPNGIWDQTNNLPIFRRGVLATDYKYDWNGKKEFLIDAACFPGSSGSPVLQLDVGGYQSRKGSFWGTSRIKLLGVLYAGPQHTVKGDVKIVVVPAHQKAISVAGIPNNLGIIIKAERLLAFESMFS